MTNLQAKTVQLARWAAEQGNRDFVARALSAEIRGARRDSDKTDILAVARELNIEQHPLFVL